MAISNALADKFSNILHAHRGDVFDEKLLQMNNSKVSGFSFTVECILEAFSNLKPKKSDGTELDYNSCFASFS